MTNVEALKALYVALGNEAADVEKANTIVDVLNTIAAKYEGKDDATTNAEAIENIAEIAGSLTPTPTLITKNITENGTYAASSDNADGYSSVTVNVPSGNANFGNTPVAFTLKNIESIKIPSGVTSIASNAFNACTNLTSIEIPSSVTSIGINTFNGCKNLTSIEIPSSVTSIGEVTFEGCTQLATITIHKAEGSITGAPWGAPNTTTVVWDG